MTRDDIIAMAREAGIVWGAELPYNYEIFAALVAAHEREMCAQVCENIAADHALHDSNISAGAAEDCAELIRARGETK